MIFFYKKFHSVNNTQVSLDIVGQEQWDNIVDVEILINNKLQTIISLGKNCTLSQLCIDMINEDEVTKKLSI